LKFGFGFFYSLLRHKKFLLKILTKESNRLLKTSVLNVCIPDASNQKEEHIPKLHLKNMVFQMSGGFEDKFL